MTLGVVWFSIAFVVVVMGLLVVVGVAFDHMQRWAERQTRRNGQPMGWGNRKVAEQEEGCSGEARVEQMNNAKGRTNADD